MILITTRALFRLVSAPAAPPDAGMGICKSGLGHAIQQEVAPADLVAGAAAPAIIDTDVLHYDIEIVPATHWLGGTNTITVRSLIDGLTTCEIRLRETSRSAPWRQAAHRPPGRARASPRSRSRWIAWSLTQEPVQNAVCPVSSRPMTSS